MLSQRSCRARMVSAIVASVAFLVGTKALAQGFIASSMSRPFVTGIEPIRGSRGNVVGGVLVDAKGIVKRAQPGSVSQLRRLRTKLLQGQGLTGKISQKSELRKVSLRKLEEEIFRLRKANQPLTEEVLRLAGLQNIRYVIAVPEKHDIILAGYAEAWKVDANGEYVGTTTGKPVMNLDDLLVAMRVGADPVFHGISCSIDPTSDGLGRLAKLNGRLRGTGKAVAKRIARAVGKQRVAIKGVPTSSHFARVLLAADYRMKCLAMALEKSPVATLPSYMEMLRSSTSQLSGSIMPRWWLEPNFHSIKHDPQRLVWELNNTGVKVLSKLEGQPCGRQDQQAKEVQDWADSMTRHYEELSRSIPVFGKLRNCMELAVVGALIRAANLRQRTRNPFGILLDKKNVKFTPWHVPSRIDSQASFVRRGVQTIVSVSGGVWIDPAKPIQKPEMKASLARVGRSVQWKARSKFWWD